MLELSRAGVDVQGWLRELIKAHRSVEGQLIVTAEQVRAWPATGWSACVAGRTAVFLGYSGRDLNFQPVWDAVLAAATRVLWFDFWKGSATTPAGVTSLPSPSTSTAPSSLACLSAIFLLPGSCSAPPRRDTRCTRLGHLGLALVEAANGDQPSHAVAAADVAGRIGMRLTSGRELLAHPRQRALPARSLLLLIVFRRRRDPRADAPSSLGENPFTVIFNRLPCYSS